MTGISESELERTIPGLMVEEATEATGNRRGLPSDRECRDDAMMYAWSIGTTRAAAEHAAPKREEECPPEVYIG